MLLQVSRKDRHGVLILLAEKRSPAQIGILALLRRVPFACPLKICNASRALALVGGDGSQIVESLGDCAEIVVVDSGSTDATPAIVEDFIRRGFPIRFIRQPVLDVHSGTWTFEEDVAAHTRHYGKRAS